MAVRRRFGVRATAPDAMARQLALLRAFRDLERRRIVAGAVAGVLVVAGIAAVVAHARPGPFLTVASLAVAAATFAIVTFVVAAIARPRRFARAIELYRWVDREECRRWRAATGETPPSSPARARAWLEGHPAAGGTADLPRIALLVWTGEYEAARQVARALPTSTAEHRFERALQVATVDYIATGDGDLAETYAAAARVPDATRSLAEARLAVEAARRTAAETRLAERPHRGTSARPSARPNLWSRPGTWLRAPVRSRPGAEDASDGATTHGASAATIQLGDFVAPLALARDAQGAALDGFLLPDLARWVARPLLIVGAFSALTTFIAAGVLPPR